MVADGSTITQQLAESLFLSDERHYVRKGEELTVTWMFEFWLGKERVLEIYLNSVEWDEGVFDAEAAAQHYFRRPALQLAVRQVVRLVVALPAPKCFDKKSYCVSMHINFTRKATVVTNHMDSAALPD